MNVQNKSAGDARCSFSDGTTREDFQMRESGNQRARVERKREW